MGNLLSNRSERPQLTEREISYIVLHTNFTRKQIETFYIRFLSYYPRGYLTFDQFDQLYSGELRHLAHARAFLEKLFRQIDTDRNGKLTFKEIIFFKGLTRPETSDEERLRWIFFLYDTNDDRKIDLKEFIQLYRLIYFAHGRLLSERREKRLRDLFFRFDRNGDRALNWTEFRNLCEEAPDLLELMSPMFQQTEWKLQKRNYVRTPTNDLSAEQLDYLMKRTKFTSEQIRHYHHLFLSRCQSGQLSKSEFIEFYQQLLQSDSSSSYSELIFRAFDHLSENDLVDFDEFLIAIYIHSNQSSAKEKLEWLYNAYDRNGDGSIDYQEIFQIVRSLFLLHRIDERTQSVSYVTYQIMAALDLNDDNRISRQEFLNLLKHDKLTAFLAPSFVKQEKTSTPTTTPASLT